jgi:hypothetical protein
MDDVSMDDRADPRPPRKPSLLDCFFVSEFFFSEFFTERFLSERLFSASILRRSVLF